MNNNVVQFFKQVFQEWNQDKVPRLAAALAYFTIFSIAPFFIIVIAIAGFIFGREAATDQIVGQLQGLMGTAGAEAVQGIIQRANEPQGGLVATVIGLVTLFIGSTGFFGQLQDALNTIWRVQPRPDLGIKNIIYSRATSFVVVLGVGFLLLITLVLSTVLSAFGDVLGGYLPGGAGGLALQLINFVISFLVTTLLFAMIYRLLPDAKVAWSDVWIGATITALLFAIGRYLIGFYIGNSNFTDTYGASGAIIVVLIWVYFASLILLLGAEFTFVYAQRYGSQIVPNEHAVAMTDEDLAQQGAPRHEQLQQIVDKQDQRKARSG
ncbi:MAG: YihY/virulence factor BrkB family protein [Chloroflexaceae bacterium]|nr:YihY/virulence factor BrkB family protein [Chloroflexaceae bacterium]NJL33243.1 YihY/virulence factor BrkB family protein [Chloroflexaceae bacterium]